MEEDTVFIPDWAWDSTIPLSEIIIATEPGSTRPGSRGFASWCSLNKKQADGATRFLFRDLIKTLTAEFLKKISVNPPSCRRPGLSPG